MDARQAGGEERSTADRLMCYANLVFVLFSQCFFYTALFAPCACENLCKCVCV